MGLTFEGIASGIWQASITLAASASKALICSIKHDVASATAFASWPYGKPVAAGAPLAVGAPLAAAAGGLPLAGGAAAGGGAASA